MTIERASKPDRGGPTPEHDAWLLRWLEIDVASYPRSGMPTPPSRTQDGPPTFSGELDDGVYRPDSGDAGGRDLFRPVQGVEPEMEPEPFEAERELDAESEARRERENENDRRADQDGRPRTPPGDRELDWTQERLRRAQADTDPQERGRAYSSGKHILGRLDPANKLAGPELRKQGWIPDPNSLQDLDDGITDARNAPGYGLSVEQYRSLAEDPDHRGAIDRDSREERDTALNAVRDRQMKGPLGRDTKGGDFVDANRQQWDVKSFRSKWRNGFNRAKSADAIDDELRRGENVLVNTGHMSDQDVKLLKEEGVLRNWGNRVLYNRSNRLPDFLLGPANQIPGGQNQ